MEYTEADYLVAKLKGGVPPSRKEVQMWPIYTIGNQVATMIKGSEYLIPEESCEEWCDRMNNRIVNRIIR